MKKKTITKTIIAKVYYQTIDTQPFYETKGRTHSERIIDWFELNNFNITNNSVANIYNYIKVRKEISKQIKFSLNNDR